MGFPDPLKDLPSISILMGILMTSPVNSQWVCKLSIPDVPSKIYIKWTQFKLPGRLPFCLQFPAPNPFWLCRLQVEHWRSLHIYEKRLDHDWKGWGGRYGWSVLPWEFDIIESNQWSFHIEDCSVINSGSDVVVLCDCFNVFFCHFALWFFCKVEDFLFFDL